MSITSELLIILGLILANGVFAGAEIAILSVRKTRVRELSDEGSRSARAILQMREHPETFLATVQIGITVVGATAAAFGGATLAQGLAAVLVRLNAGTYADDLALALVVGLISYLSLVIGELVPKSLALRSAERYALLIARPLRGLSWVARPIVWFLTVSSNVVLRLFRDKTTFTEARLSREELQQLVEEASTAGTLDARAGEIAHRALEFGEVRVGSVMVPRPDIVTLSDDAGRDEVRALLAGRGHSRIPIHQGSPENIIGYVTARDLMAFAVGEDAGTIRALVRTGLFVPEAVLAAKVLKDMQRTRDHLALVVDEFGTVAGLVTLEDLVEELVGEIFAEHETPLERIHREDDGASALVRGRVPVHEVNRELGIELPEGPNWSTIGGLVTSLAGRLPTVGMRLEAGRVTLEIVEASERRVLTIRVHLDRKDAEP